MSIEIIMMMMKIVEVIEIIIEFRMRNKEEEPIK
jgi:hypothetical protein